MGDGSWMVSDLDHLGFCPIKRVIDNQALTPLMCNPMMTGRNEAWVRMRGQDEIVICFCAGAHSKCPRRHTTRSSPERAPGGRGCGEKQQVCAFVGI